MVQQKYIPNIGERVILVGAEKWGAGQVQSSIGMRVTVNFPEAGKQLIDLNHATLVASDIDNDV